MNHHLEALVLLSDEPIGELTNDGLHLTSWATVVASVAVGTEGPFTIGVFGQWGTGKTSILQLSKKLVDDSEQGRSGEITTVFFNAWQYEQESNPLVPLIASILERIDERNGGIATLREAAKSLRDALRSVLFGLSVKATARGSMLGELSLGFEGGKAIERYEELRSKWIDVEIDRSLYHNAFKVLRETQDKEDAPTRHRIVVFIDDLDRCFPSKAIQLLESIKLVLNQSGFVFVLGVDRNILETYLNKRYSEEFGLKEYHQGQSYLDKLIQLPLWIPPHENRFHGLVAKLLKHPALDQHSEGLSPLMNIICLACEHNPRQLVRFFNDLLVDNHIYHNINPGQGFPFGAFIVARGLRHQSELIYQGLLRDEYLCQELRTCDDENEMRRLLVQLIAEPDRGELSGDLLRRLQTRSSLLRLMTSSPAKEWLSNSELRGRVDNFLAEERQFDQRKQMVLERALKQIEAADEDSILAGLQVLWAFDDPLRLKALGRITELTRSDRPRISRQALATMQRLKQSTER